MLHFSIRIEVAGNKLITVRARIKYLLHYSTYKNINIISFFFN